MAVLRLDEATTRKLLDPDNRDWAFRYFRSLSKAQQVALVKKLQEAKEKLGLGGVRYEDPVTMGILTESQAWRWLREAPHLMWLSKKVAGALKAGKNLAIEMPPRMGKTSLCSIWAPAWKFSENAKSRVILLTYADNFASQSGETVRNLITEFGSTWGLGLDPENTSKKDWKTTAGGFMLSAGIGGQVLGRGADLLICDDLMKEQDADSPLIRDQIYKLVEGTAQSRVEVGGSILIIMQRFHEDDIIGRLEKQKALGEGLGATFEFVRVPALAEKEDPLGRAEGMGLWPQCYPQSYWESRRETTSPQQWSAMYQQRPSPEGGGLVLRTWFGEGVQQPASERKGWTSSTVPLEFDRVIQSWDLPLKDKSTSDFASGFVLGIKDAVVYVLDGWLKRAGLPEILQQVRLFQHLYPAAGFKLLEDAASAPAFYQMFRRHLAGIVLVKVGTSKTARLNASIPAMASGNVLFPLTEGGVRPRWAWDSLEQLFAFPKGAHDDAVDALTLGINWLDPLGHAGLLRKGQGMLDGIPGPAFDSAAAMRSKFFKAVKELADENQDPELGPEGVDDLPPDLPYSDY